ncbi:MAG: 50S ribosomal protein L11 methyltransferase [Candidatus Limnocylindria bacterium]
MRWLELSVEAGSEAVEAVSEILCRLGRGAAVRPTRLLTQPGDELSAREDHDAPYILTAHVPNETTAADEVESTRRALWHLQAFGLGPVGELRIRDVDDEQWADAWRAHYAPQRFGRIVIVPSWMEERIAADEVAIRLDPGMAFGTGLHPSTRGCLVLMQRSSPPKALLDVGSGSGILAIAGVKLGAETATCLDVDPVAVDATRRNAQVNDVADRIDALHGTLPLRPPRRFALVCANLVARVLVELADELVAHLADDAELVAGGIVSERATEVELAFAERRVSVIERLADANWVTLRLGRGTAASAAVA